MSSDIGSNTGRKRSSRKRVYGKLGQYETRLAERSEEVLAAQRVRYDVFRKQAPSANSRDMNRGSLERDSFDEGFDHLLIIDTLSTENHGVVGTQRLQTRYGNQGFHGLYSLSQFDLEPLAQRHPSKCFMELGRSCILPQYRSKRTMELLWHGTWDYAVKNEVDVMFGCASFPTTDPGTIATLLAFLHDSSPANGPWKVSARSPEQYTIPPFAADPGAMRKIIRNLPPLIKGYLRLGAKFSEQACVDREFGTTDILVVLPVQDINPRYVAFYGAEADRHARASDDNSSLHL